MTSYDRSRASWANGHISLITLLSLGFCLTLSVAVAQPRSPEVRLGAVIDAVRWGMTPTEFDTAMRPLCARSEADTASNQLRYGNPFGSCGYEVIPDYADGRLQSVLIRFSTGGHAAGSHDAAELASRDPFRRLYARTIDVLWRRFDKPRFDANSMEMYEHTGDETALTYWHQGTSHWIVERSKTDRYIPLLAIVGMEDHAYDSMRRSLKKQSDKHLRYLSQLYESLKPFPDDTLMPAASFSRDTERSIDLEPDEFVAVEQMPLEIHHERPKYPEAARKKKRTATVWVQVLVDGRGVVCDAVILRPSGASLGFEEAALEAAYKNRYKPAIQNGQPVPVWVSYRVTFEP